MRVIDKVEVIRYVEDKIQYYVDRIDFLEGDSLYVMEAYRRGRKITNRPERLPKNWIWQCPMNRS